MADGIISTDAPLTADQRGIVQAVINLIIPVSDDGRMPSAADYDMIGYIAAHSPHHLPAIANDADKLDRAAHEKFEAGFVEMTFAEQLQLCESLRSDSPDLFRALATDTAICYYQQDAVLEALGLGARAPFPQGYSVKTGDLSLLDPVRSRGPIYREA